MAQQGVGAGLLARGPVRDGGKLPHFCAVQELLVDEEAGLLASSAKLEFLSGGNRSIFLFLPRCIHLLKTGIGQGNEHNDHHYKRYYSHVGCVC